MDEYQAKLNAYLSETCTWVDDDPYWGRWKSGCGNTFDFAAYSDPEENDFVHCPFCGKPLEMVEPADV